MKNVGHYLPLIIFLFTIGCHNNQYKESREIYKESIAIHDEVMPLMGEIMMLQKELKESILTVKDDPDKVKKINQAISDLESAHDGMMIWMRKLKSIPNEHENGHGDHNHHTEHETNNLPPEEMLVLQKTQKDEITSVKEAILESIEEARRILKK